MRTVLVVLAGLVLASPSPAPALAAGASPGPTAVPTAAGLRGPPADSTALVRIERMGGFAGIHESWTLHASGQIWFLPMPGVEASLLRTLGAELMEQVRGAVGASPGRGPAWAAGVECSDCFVYRIVVMGPGSARDIMVGEHRLAEASAELRTLVGLVAGVGPPPLSLPGTPGPGIPGPAGTSRTPPAPAD
ncbi:MAG: hypothetical protein EA350_17200 [Gemmatimonadales bacterium]|nr:MAG: hypothetical protein EA350_17200 [Gemmatimonadales bacterium]